MARHRKWDTRPPAGRTTFFEVTTIPFGKVLPRVKKKEKSQDDMKKCRENTKTEKKFGKKRCNNNTRKLMVKWGFTSFIFVLDTLIRTGRDHINEMHDEIAILGPRGGQNCRNEAKLK
jgi:hypothetical protein